MAMGPVVGIDLGTTNTVVAVVKNGQAAALADESGEKLIPSVVAFHPNGNVLVGREAKARRLNDAANTIYSIKRLIGRSWSSEEVRVARSRFPFEMRDGPGQAALVVARGETYTLPEISAFVLRKAKTLAENALGQQIERAVITVPANFNDLQRAATKVAGRVAGLEVLRILNEPTAAALAYGYGKDSAERLAVYDSGGGTFDVTLLDLSDNVFEVLATAGNTFLGGDDIDLAIAEKMAGDFLAQHRYDPRSDPQAFERLRNAAEMIKVRLSSLPETSVEVPEVAHGPGGKALDLTFSMSRTELERIARPIIDRSFDVCREALGIARMQVSDFDQVLLVGGSTRIPAVRRRVEDFFKRSVLATVSPDEVVAIGAAIQANALTHADRRRSAIPEPPQPASRGSRPPSARKSRPPPIPKRGGTLPPGAQRPGTPGVFPSTEPQTRPFGRKRMPTSPGLQPGSGVKPLPTSGKPMIVQPPDTAVEQAGARSGSGPGSTLASAHEAAREARRRTATHADIPLPLVGVDDSDTEDQTVRSNMEKKELTPDEVAAKYGDLPLIMPDPSAATPPPAPARPPATPGKTQALGSPARQAPPTSPVNEQSVPVYSLDAGDLEDVTSTRQPHPGTLSPTLIEESEESLPIPGVPGQAPPGPAPQAGAAPTWEQQPQPAQQGWGVPLASPLVPQPPPEPLIHDFVPPQAPLLVDVTPLSLTVETVSGFCDTIIERNTAVPVERTRNFVTAADQQTSVRVRVGQGESSRFGDNTLLGEVELSGLRPAPRGEVSIAVTFALDTDGILGVRATDTATGRATETRVRLVGMPDAGQITEMAARHAAHPTL